MIFCLLLTVLSTLFNHLSCNQQFHEVFEEHRFEQNYVPHFSTSLYYMEQTVAMVTYTDQGDMSNCELFDVGSKKKRQDLLTSMEMRPTNVDLRNMVTMVDSCQNVRSGRHARSRSKTSLPQYFNVFSGIMPGTKWCGHNNVARSYEDLGTNVEVDKCCRAHDYCPLKIQPFTKRYGVFNFGFYTKSHCMCDSMFYRCLKQSGNNVATIVGNIFFNILQVQCVKEKYSQSCLQERVLDTGQLICDRWGYRDGDGRALHVVSPSVTY